MQVVNQSLGAGRQWPQYPTAQAATRLVNKGVVMVASIGNSGPGGSSPDALFAAGAPGVGAKVIGVASLRQQRSARSSSTARPMATTRPPARHCRRLRAACRWRAPARRRRRRRVRCAAPGSLTGTAVLIRRGTCGFYIKAFNAQNAGAAAVVLYNNAAGALNPTVAGDAGRSRSQWWRSPPPKVRRSTALIAAGPTTLTWDRRLRRRPVRHRRPDLGIQFLRPAAGPQLQAEHRRAGRRDLLDLPARTWRRDDAVGHVDVVAACRRRRRADPAGEAQASVRRRMMTRLQNSADPKNWSGNPALGLLDSRIRQGAGMLDIVGTIQATTRGRAEPDRARAKARPGRRPMTITVKNGGCSASSTTCACRRRWPAGPTRRPARATASSGIFDAPATVSVQRAERRRWQRAAARASTSRSPPMRGCPTAACTVATSR